MKKVAQFVGENMRIIPCYVKEDEGTNDLMLFCEDGDKFMALRFNRRMPLSEAISRLQQDYNRSVKQFGKEIAGFCTNYHS